MTTDGTTYGIHAGRVASGLVILALGALMLLDRHDVLGRHTFRFFPGAVLVVIGAAQLLSGDCGRHVRRGRRGSFGGFWLVFVGAWLIVNESHLMGLTYRDSWPILVIGAGVMIVLRELFGPRVDVSAADDAASTERR